MFEACTAGNHQVKSVEEYNEKVILQLGKEAETAVIAVAPILLRINIDVYQLDLKDEVKKMNSLVLID